MRVEHVYKLLDKFPLGIIILFESELIKWQKNTSVNGIIVQRNLSNEIVQAQVCVQNTSHSQKTFKLKLDEVLQSSGKGPLIVDYYKKHNKLNDGIRTTLVDLIVSHMVTKHIPMPISLAKCMANQIVAMLKTEIEDTYFMEIGNNRNPKGKLYTKYFNSVRNLKTNGLIESSSTIGKDKTNDNSSDCTQSTSGWTQNDFVQEKDIECVLNELKHDSTSFPDLERNWKATINYRLNYIKNSSSTNDILKCGRNI
ncbi:hypothetical protein QTP88_017431 [Uroleucon formosanum]